MERDKLFLLRSGFEDPAYPGRRFYCWHCALLEGVLVSVPELALRLEVERIDWRKPRLSMANLVGSENQSAPLLVLADDAPDELATRLWGSTRFVEGKNAILRVLSIRHGAPDPHP